MSEVRDTAQWLSRQLTANQTAINALSAPQLASSSIEAGTVAEYDNTGTLVSAVGTQFDGTHAAVTLAGPVPPEPNPPTITPGNNTAEVRWDGTFANGALSPMDFSHVSVHASVLESFTPDNTTQKATISGESGDKATLALDSGEWYFSLVAVSLAGKWSDPSAPVLAEVQDFQQDTVTDALIAYDSSITAVQTSVNGKNSITNQTTIPTVTAGFVTGDRWQQWSTLATGGKLLATWRFDGTQWLQESIDPTYLPQVDIGAGTFGSLDGGRITAKTISTQSLVVGALDNLLEEPSFNLGGKKWGTFNAAYYTFPTTGGRTGGMCQATGFTGRQLGPVSVTQMPHEDGDSYRLAGWVMTTATSGHRGEFTLYWYDANGAYMGNAGLNIDTATSTWARFNFTPKPPTGARFVNVRVTATLAATTDKYYFDDLSLTRAMRGELIVDGEVKASKLEASLVLASEIVAGNPTGNHASMTPSGFKVMAVPAGGTTPTQVVSLGTAGTSDYLNVTDSTGKTVASIGSAGDMTANSMNVATDVTIAGTLLSDSLKTTGKGLMAWASRSTDGTYYAGLTEQPYLSLQVDGIIAGRAYMIQTTPIHTFSDTTGSDAVIKLHLGPGTRIATINDPVIDQAYSIPSSLASGGMRSAVTFTRLVTPVTNDSLSLLIGYMVESSGRAKIMANGFRPVMITVTDIGLGMPQTGEDRNGTANAAAGATGGGETTPPSIRKNYDQTWTATGSRSFDGSGNLAGTDGGSMYTGVSPAAGYGDMSSMAVFPDLTSTLAGATVTGVWAYLYFDYWDNPAGSTANIALHGMSALTSNKPALSYATYAASPNWPQASGRWVKINSSTYAGWAAGTHKGFVLGGTGSSEPYGYAHNPQLRITYTK